MTLEALRVFCAVVEEKSFRGAASRIYRSQPAVSQQVKALERELGQTLLERKTCRPTPAGQRLYQRARRVINDLDGLTREIKDFDETQEMELRVGTSDTTALYVLPPVVRTFARALPRTHLVLVNRPTEAIAEQVLRGELDLGIVTLPVSNDALIEEDLFQQRIVLVVPARHRMRAAKAVTLDELRNEPLLLLQGETRSGALLRDHFRRAGFDPRVVLDSGSFEVIKRYVAQGIGVAFLPEMVVTRADRTLAVVQVSGLPGIRIGAIWRRGAYRTKAESAFLDLVKRRGAEVSSLE